MSSTLLLLFLAVIDGRGITVTSEGTITSRPAVYYPQTAWSQRLEGLVSAVLTLDADGNVADANIVSGPLALRRTVLESVLSWKYEPSGTSGRQVLVRVAFRTVEGLPDPAVEVSVRPRVLKRVDPIYPDEARRVRYQGTVVLEATVQADGSVRVERIVRSLDGPATPGMDRAAIEALEQWRFAPALKNGIPVPVVLTIEVQFNLR